MNNLFSINRELRDIADPKLRSRELTIKRIQASYGYDRENAEKVYEMMRVRNVEFGFGTACGAVAAYKWTPIQRDLEHSFSIFKKPWMRVPVRLGVFAATYYISVQLPSRMSRYLSPNSTGIT